MKELRDAYLTKLPAQIDLFETAIAALENGDVDAHDSIRRVAHQLKGSGASFGFPEITDRALAILKADEESLADVTRTFVSYLTELSPAIADHREKILVVDDDPAIQMLIAHSLQSPDRDILMTSTMSAGWDALDYRPTLLILDLFLPDADGRELLGKLRRNPDTADLIVVVLSGSNSAIARSECLALGASAFIEKPFDPASFSTLIDSLLRADGLAAQKGVVAPPLPETKKPDGEATRRILLAEDDDLVAALIVDRLGRDGFEVIRCSDGEMALAEAQKSPPDLMILDVKMPKMDGFEVLMNSRELPELEDTAIIMLTAMGSEHDVVRGFDLGATDYVLKPFSPTELAARVLRLVPQP